MRPERIAVTPASLPRRMFLKIREQLVALQVGVLRRVFGMTIGPGTRISLRAKLDITYPKGVHIGSDTYIAFGVVIFAHDMCRALRTNTFVGDRCFLGANCVIMPGIRVGDDCIVGSGAVVTSDVPSGSIVAGNPARVIRSGIKVGRWGILIDEAERASALNAVRELDRTSA